MTYPPSPYAAPAVQSAPRIDDGGQHRIVQLVLGIVLFVVSQLAVAAVLFLASAQSGSFNTNPWLFLLAMSTGAAVSLGGYWLIMRFIARRCGVGTTAFKAMWEFVLGLLIGAVLIAVSVGIIHLFGGYQIHGLAPVSQAVPGLVSALAIGVGAGFMEEILFRGFGMRLLHSWFGWVPALLITSMLFGGVHLSNPESSVWGAIAIMLEAGVLLGAAFLLTRRVWLTVGIHVSWNFVQAGIFGSDVSGTGDRVGLIEATWEGPAWLTGAEMGMEASIVTVVVALGAGLTMLFLAHSHGMLAKPLRRAHIPDTAAPDAPTT